VDHADNEATKDFCARAVAARGAPHILCANAGIAIAGRMEEMTIEEWRRIVDVNLLGTVHVISHFLDDMISARDGHILVTASAAGLAAAPGLAAYSATKFALVGLCEALRMELSKYRINVSALCPGVINTAIVADGVIHHADEAGASRKTKVVEFYKSRGASPDVVARQAIRGLKKRRGVILSPPSHVWPMHVAKRLSDRLYTAAGGYVWRKGWLM
jgi:short-subunit dehydrogenase